MRSSFTLKSSRKVRQKGRSVSSSGPSFALIHPSAWNRNSANFAVTAFYEVQSSRGPTARWRFSRRAHKRTAIRSTRVVGYRTLVWDSPPAAANTCLGWRERLRRP
jgi:hypothetical protein